MSYVSRAGHGTESGPVQNVESNSEVRRRVPAILCRIAPTYFHHPHHYVIIAIIAILIVALETIVGGRAEMGHVESPIIRASIPSANNTRTDVLKTGNAPDLERDYTKLTGPIRHWAKSTVLVYVVPDPNGGKSADAMAQDVTRSVALWNNAVGNTVKLTLTGSASQADITVTFVKSGSLPDGACGLTTASFYPKERRITDATIQLPEGMSDGELVQAGAHEFGHALGIGGHSDDAKDLMYPVVHVPAGITERDKNTLLTGYLKVDLPIGTGSVR